MDSASLTFDIAVARVKKGEKPAEVAAELLRELTSDEWLWLLDGDVPFWPGFKSMMLDGYNRTPYAHGVIRRIGIPGILFTDGPRGVTVGEGATTFPVSTARGATWDVSLEQRIGLAIGREARIKGANFFGGVCINLPRHPAWGRVQETYGEDPLLLGKFGAALTRGVQKNVIACAKHFALNSIENSRFQVDVVVDEAALHEVYLPHFRHVVEEGCMSIMSSYNSVNGEWAGQNKVLLEDILRGQWKFQGFVMSDFMMGLRDPALSVKNGLDIEACFRQQRAQHLPEALSTEKLYMADVKKAGKRILATQLKYTAERDAEEPNPNIFFGQEHRNLAREAASRSIVLLQNNTVNGQPLLPLNEKNMSTCAVIGRLANAANTGDHGSSSIRNSGTTTSPFEGITAALPKAKVILADSNEVSEAVEAALSVDVVILVVGYDHTDEGESIVPSIENNPALGKLLPSRNGSDAAETVIQALAKIDEKGTFTTAGSGGDRKSIRLHTRDVEIINAVVAVNPRTIVTIITAGAVIMEEWRQKVPAILIGWYNGCEGGHALADVLLGRVNVSGRLPHSIPTSEEHLPFFERDTKSIIYDRWFGQRLLDRLGVPAAFPLGYGLSYTSFFFWDLIVGPTRSETIHITVRVSNTGSREGRHIVQVYGKLEVPDFPSRVLIGFAPVDLASGETKIVTVEASTRPMQRWVDGKFVLSAREVGIEVGGYAGDPAGLSSRYQLGKKSFAL